MAAYQTKGPSVTAHFMVRDESVEKVELGVNQSEELCWSVDGASQKTEKAICDWMEAYAEKKVEPMRFPISFGELTPFTYTVLETIKRVPFGKFLSYKELAESLKKPRAARAVGSACGRNPLPLLVPCHRILASGVGLGGFLIDIEIKRRLLAFEGIL